VNRTKHRADMGRLSQVACYFPSFVDAQGKRTGCDFLDLGDGVGLCHTPVLKSTELKPLYVCPGCLITHIATI
jgi:hypothetical protein